MVEALVGRLTETRRYPQRIAAYVTIVHGVRSAQSSGIGGDHCLTSRRPSWSILPTTHSCLPSAAWSASFSK